MLKLNSIKLKLAILLSFLGSMLNAQDNNYRPTVQNLDNRSSFQDMRFGMFIHWGAFSVLGNGEWVMNNKNIQVDDYHKLGHIFNPQKFDAAQWVTAAKNAGMNYITFVTRHHDSFSNWDTKQSDWKITNTPYGKDVLKSLANECKKQGVKLFLYYSLLDWSRTDYQYQTGRTGQGTGRTVKGEWLEYIQFMKAQLTELLTNYGEIAGVWFDGDWDQRSKDGPETAKVDWHYPEIYGLIHRLQPGCLIGNNHHLKPFVGEDFQMFEKDLPGMNTSGFGGADVSQLPLETCETMNDSWGFNITDRNYKSSTQLIRYLINAAGRNANFLLNIGPLPDGTVQQEFTDTLKLVGEWVKKNGASIYGTRGNIIAPQEWGMVTAKEKSFYVHVLTPVNGSFIFLPNLKQKIKSAKLFNNNAAVKFKQTEEGVFIYTTGVKMDTVDTIIELLQ